MGRKWTNATRFVAAAAVVVLAVGCAGGDGPGPAAAPSTDGAFPVTVAHAFGSTTVEAPPQRVVTLGVTDADLVLALGVTPVAVTGYPFYESGLGPWATGLVQGQPPVVLASDVQPDLEQVAALAPDLIIGLSAGFQQDVYDDLSRIAPTIARPADALAYTVPRDDAQRTVATVLGRAEAGEELVRATGEAFAAAIAAHPEFAGRTGSVVLPYEGRYGAYTPGDSRGQFLTGLGFVQPPAIVALGPSERFFTEISSEQTGLLDGDVLVVLAGQPAQEQAIAQDAVLAQVPVVAQGRMIVTDLDTRGAMTYNSALSVPYALERLVPQLATALAAQG